MDSMRRAGLFLMAAAVCCPAALQAQDYRFGAGYSAGGVYFTPLNGNAAAVNGAAATDIKLSTGWIVGLQFEEWLGSSGRLGLRANGALTERSITVPGETRDIGIWLADLDVLLRLFAPHPERRTNVFLSLGAGAVQYRLGQGDFLAYESADAAYPGSEKIRFAGAGGLGLDWVTGWTWDGEPVGIRLEAVDHVVLDSPFKRISGGDFSPIHNVRFVIGAFTGFGLLH